MLTKDLLKYRTRKDQIYPQFVDSQDEGISRYGKDITDIFLEAKGQKSSDVRDQIEDLGHHSLRQAFEKLLFDRCDFTEDNESIEKRRWDLLIAAQELRSQTPFDSLESFQNAFRETHNLSPDFLEHELYGDLPEFRKIESFRAFPNSTLVHRYNCAQIQGLLLRSEKVSLKIGKCTAPQVRRLFNMIKFHQLLVKINKSDQENRIDIEITGPLSLFEQTKKYSMQIANFFPHILHLPQWELLAEVEVKKKNKFFTLKIDQSCKIDSHYRDTGGFIPEEWDDLLKNFEANQNDYKLTLGENLLNLGKQNYSFPDFMITSVRSKKIRPIELFHRWHKGQLLNRLSFLESSSDAVTEGLLIGVCRSIANSKEIKSVLGESTFFAKNGFLFRDSPTTKQLVKLAKDTF